MMTMSSSSGSPPRRSLLSTVGVTVALVAAATTTVIIHPADAAAFVSQQGVRPSTTRTTFGTTATTTTTGRTNPWEDNVIQRNYRDDDGLGFDDNNSHENKKLLHENRKRDYLNRSVKYYRTVRRMKGSAGQLKTTEEDGTITDGKMTAVVVPAAAKREEGVHHHSDDDNNVSAARMASLEENNHSEFLELATKHYCALRKIKSGEFDYAEKIYRREIDKVTQHRQEEGSCDHDVLAASTLLLALLKQRMGDIKGTRKVFTNFFRIVSEDELQNCPCSAKVVQAFALFEMKQNHGKRSLYLARKAVTMDSNLAPVLKWKLFRDVAASSPASSGTGTTTAGGR